MITWFQNRRAKLKRDVDDTKPGSAENSSSPTKVNADKKELPNLTTKSIATTLSASSSSVHPTTTATTIPEAYVAAQSRFQLLPGDAKNTFPHLPFPTTYTSQAMLGRLGRQSAKTLLAEQQTNQTIGHDKTSHFVKHFISADTVSQHDSPVKRRKVSSD